MGAFLQERIKALKITHVISDSNIGGAGVLLASVASELKSDFDFEIIIPKGSLLRERLSFLNLKIIELPISADKSFSAKDTLKFYNYFKKHPTDILHTHASLSSRLGGKLAGTGICISTRHCAKPEVKIKKQSFLKRKVYNYCTDKTVSTADFATNNLICEGINQDKIITIKNGSKPPRELDSLSKAEILHKLNLDKDCRIIGSCARLEPVKGQDLILRVAPSILEKFPNTHFLFLGEGSKKEEYKKLASTLGIEKKVTFLGYVDDPSLYQNVFYINVNASRGTETSCLATSECMALGVPTVASDFGGNTEMIKDNENGIIFACDNLFSLERALISILKDTALHEKLSAGAKISFEKSFSSGEMAKQYKKLYNSLFDKKTKQNPIYNKKD